MNANLRRPLQSLIALLLAATVARAASSGEGGTADRSVAVRSSLDVPVPDKLRALLLDDPMVRFLVTVDEAGRVVEQLAVEATHHDLLGKAEQVMAGAQFEPAVAEGRAVTATVEARVTFFDPEQRAVQSGMAAQPFGSSASDAAARRVYEGAKDRFAFRQSTPAELDAPLAMAAGKLMVLADDEGRTASGQCVVDYFVDRHGRATMARIVSSDNETVARSALLTLQQIRFVPPTREGRPTCVQVRQPFIYEGGPPAPEGS
jgi:TonB family protein